MALFTKICDNTIIGENKMRKRGEQIYPVNISEKIGMKNVMKKWNSISLVLRIICGLIIGIILGLVIPKVTVIALLGDWFVAA